MKGIAGRISVNFITMPGGSLFPIPAARIRPGTRPDSREETTPFTILRN